MKWYWIMAIVLLSVVVGYIIANIMPAQIEPPGDNGCDCIKKRVLPLKPRNEDEMEAYIEAYMKIIKECCYPKTVGVAPPPGFPNRRYTRASRLGYR